jgi:hypothetical protein
MGATRLMTRTKALPQHQNRNTGTLGGDDLTQFVPRS